MFGVFGLIGVWVPKISSWRATGATGVPAPVAPGVAPAAPAVTPGVPPVAPGVAPVAPAVPPVAPAGAPAVAPVAPVAEPVQFHLKNHQNSDSTGLKFFIMIKYYV